MLCARYPCVCFVFSFVCMLCMRCVFCLLMCMHMCMHIVYASERWHPTLARVHTHTCRGLSPKMLVAESAAADLARVLLSRRRPGCMSLSLHPEPYT